MTLRGLDDGVRWGRAFRGGRGGVDAQAHLVCEGQGLAMAVPITAGRRPESTQSEAVLGQVLVPRRRGRPRRRPRKLAGGKSYDSPADPASPAPPGPRGGDPDPEGPEAIARLRKATYRRRNVVERCLGWLEDRRRLAMRFEKPAEDRGGIPGEAHGFAADAAGCPGAGTLRAAGVTGAGGSSSGGRPGAR